MSIVFRGKKYTVVESTDGEREVCTLGGEPVKHVRSFRLWVEPKPPAELEIEFVDGDFDFDSEPKK